LKKEQLQGGDFTQKDTELTCEGEIRRDSCHYNFTGWNDGECKRFIALKTSDPENFIICDNGEERPLNLEDILKWKEENPEF
jgi:hypothetical protein